MPPTLKGLPLRTVGPSRAGTSSAIPSRRFHLRLFTVSRFAGLGRRPGEALRLTPMERCPGLDWRAPSGPKAAAKPKLSVILGRNPL